MDRSQQTEVTVQIWTLIGLFISVIWFAVNITRYRDKVDNRIANLEKDCDSAMVRLTTCELKGNNADVAIAEMRQNIKGIFEALNEIKNKLK